MSVNDGKARGDYGSVVEVVLSPAASCASVVLCVRVGGAPVFALHVGLGAGRGRFVFVHVLLAHGADATRKQFVHRDRFITSRRNLRTLCWAAVTVFQSAVVLRWRLFKRLLGLAHVLNVFSGASLTLQEVKGHAGVWFVSEAGAAAD